MQCCKRYREFFEQNIPPQVLIEAPVILVDGFDKKFAFSLTWITSIEVRYSSEIYQPSNPLTPHRCSSNM
jgi:hypothetical protein